MIVSLLVGSLGVLEMIGVISQCLPWLVRPEASLFIHWRERIASQGAECEHLGAY